LRKIGKIASIGGLRLQKIERVDQFNFSSFEQFAQAIRDVDCRFILTGREETDLRVARKARILAALIRPAP
jgi:hypothetical protein